MLSEDQNSYLDALEQLCQKQAELLADALMAKYENGQLVAALQAERDVCSQRLARAGLSEADELLARAKIAEYDESLSLLAGYEVWPEAQGALEFFRERLLGAGTHKKEETQGV